MTTTTVQELLDLNQQLLDSIATCDWPAYCRLCDPTLSAFEPEARGHLIEGMEFHQFYFGLGKAEGLKNTTIAAPRVRLLGNDAAVVTYVRLVQFVDDNGIPQTAKFEETRIWQRQEDEWKHVHFHRSDND